MGDTLQVDDLVVGPNMVRAWREELASLRAEKERAEKDAIDYMEKWHKEKHRADALQVTADLLPHAQAAITAEQQRAERAEAELRIQSDANIVLMEKLSTAEAERDAAEAKLKAQAAEAYADVDEWAAYASEYFKAKWDLPGTMQKWRDRFEPDAARKGEQ